MDAFLQTEMVDMEIVAGYAKMLHYNSVCANCQTWWILFHTNPDISPVTPVRYS
jgi:hypothetical protein